MSLYDERPWGNFLILAESETHKVKRITVTPGHRLSYQRHRYRCEHWFVVSGTCIVILDDVEHVVKPGESIDIEIGVAHRLVNPGLEPVVIIEVQTGSYFGEDDIERLEDDYGRT